MLDTILLALGISFAIQIFFFIFAASFKTDKVTDLSYGLTFILIAAYFLVTNETTTSNILLASMVKASSLNLDYGGSQGIQITLVKCFYGGGFLSTHYQ